MSGPRDTLWHERTYEIGTRAVVRCGPHEWWVVCSACEAPFGEPHPIALLAHVEARRQADKTCPLCGEGILL